MTKLVSQKLATPAFLTELLTDPPISRYLKQGIYVLVLLFGGFGLWAALAPLTSAAIAPGVVKVDSYRKSLQHLDGGIVREILVRDGDIVKKGQPLIRFNGDDAAADLKSIGGQIGALKAESAAINEQLPSVEEQIKDQRDLYAKGYARKPQLFELQRALAKMKGEIAANEKRLLSLQEQERKAQAKTERSVVAAPQDGIVLNLRVHTAGGAIAPGGLLLDLVPARDKLVLEVKIEPTDIDVVRPDLPASVRFIAYKQRTTPTVDGKVMRVSADAVTEERTGMSYFLATIEVDAHQLSQLRQVKLYPGMPVEASIITGKRTFLEFLLQPLTDGFARAFHEE